MSALRAVDPEALEDLFPARVGLDGQHAGGDHLVHALGVAIDDDERHALAAQFLGDGAADAAVAAEDEVVPQFVDHATDPPLFEAEVEAALDDEGGQQGERVERGADASDEEHDREGLAGPRQRVHLAIADGRDRDHGHVEAVPDRPAFDGHVAGRPADQHQPQQADGQAWPGQPPPRGARRANGSPARG